MYLTLVNPIWLFLFTMPSFTYETDNNELGELTEIENKNDRLTMETCVNISSFTNTKDMLHIQAIGWWFDSVLHTSVCVVGLVANLISIPVLLSGHLTNNFYRTLAFLAIFDFLFITCDLLESMRRGYQNYECDNIPHYQTIHLYLFPKLLRPLQSISMMASIYTTIVVAFGRYLAVSKPITTMVNNVQGGWKAVIKYVLPVIVFSIIFKLPIFFEFYTKPCNKSCGDNENDQQFFDPLNGTEGKKNICAFV